MTSTQTDGIPSRELSHVESQSLFHRVVVMRDAFLCLPYALFENTASEARDHCGTAESLFLC